VGSNWAAFVMPDVTVAPASTTMTVLDMLIAANNWAVNGTLYYQHDRLRLLANSIFEAINSFGGI
jgi:hypothetical protein